MRKAIAVISMLVAVNAWAKGSDQATDQDCKTSAGLYYTISEMKQDGWNRADILKQLVGDLLAEDNDSKKVAKVFDMVIDDVFTTFPNDPPNDVKSIVYQMCVTGIHYERSSGKGSANTN